MVPNEIQVTAILVVVAEAVVQVDAPGSLRLAEGGNGQDEEEGGNADRTETGEPLNGIPLAGNAVEEANSYLDLGEDEEYIGQVLEEGPRQGGADGGGV